MLYSESGVQASSAEKSAPLLESNKYYSDMVIRSSSDGSPPWATDLMMPTVGQSENSFLAPYSSFPGAVGDAAAGVSEKAALATSVTDCTTMPSASSITSDDVSAQLEASRSRVAGLRRMLTREEELLQHQAEEADFLEQLRKGLEVEVAAAEAQQRAIEAKHSSHVPSTDARCRSKDSQGVDGREVSPQLQLKLDPSHQTSVVNCTLDGPLTLDDLKRHLQTVQFLKKRVSQLETALDGREEEVSRLTEDLERRRAAL